MRPKLVQKDIISPSSGHGGYRDTVATRPIATINGIETLAQKHSYGDVLISSTGKPCPVNHVFAAILNHKDIVDKDSLICFIFDMCR